MARECMNLESAWVRPWVGGCVCVCVCVCVCASTGCVQQANNMDAPGKLKPDLRMKQTLKHSQAAIRQKRGLTRKDRRIKGCVCVCVCVQRSKQRR
jgi:hypothetical protein